MIDFELVKLDIAKAIYIERIANSSMAGQPLSEDEIAQKAILSAETFITEWKKVSTKQPIAHAMTKR